MVTALGGVARMFRAAGLQRPLRVTREVADAALLRIDMPVLHARAGNRKLRGFLRHRSFLADVQRDYEPTLREFIVSSLDDGCLFVDVGAHIGFYSLIAHDAGASVIAIEPDPYNRAALMRNVGRLDVQVVAAAVSNAVGTARFHQSSSTTGSSLIERRDIAMTASVDVPTTTIDEIVGDRPGPLVLKIDVEGAEPAVLAGARETLRHARRTIVVAEVNPSALAAGGATMSDVVAPLREAGYDLRFVDQGGRTTEVPASPTKGNVVAIRQ